MLTICIERVVSNLQFGMVAIVDVFKLATVMQWMRIQTLLKCFNFLQIKQQNCCVAKKIKRQSNNVVFLHYHARYSP